MYNFYVAKNGCDSNVGSSDAPFLTISKAVEAVRELIAKRLDKPVKVTIREGEYKNDRIILDERDSGTSDCPITYEGEGKVIINGGLLLSPSDFGPLNDEEKSRLHGDAPEMVLKMDLKKYGLTRADWGEICAVGSHSVAKMYDDIETKKMSCELFVNDARMNLARYPDEGFINTEKAIFGGVFHDHEGNKISREEWGKLRNPIGDIRQIDKETVARTQTWKTLDGVWIFGYPMWGWADETSPVKNLNPEDCTMENEVVSSFGVKDVAPYYFFNVFEELDAPGEWYLDRENGIVYLYPPKPIEECDIMISITDEVLVDVKNASHITLKGLIITSTRGNAVQMIGDSNSIEACEIKNSAGWAVRMDGEHLTIKDSHIHHLGRGGIFMGGGDRNTLISSGNRITNNHVHHIAEVCKTYQQGILFTGVNCVVSHNCIHDTSHIALGFAGNDHIVEYNEIYNACKYADDSGAIYTGGDYANCGHIIRYNYFHDIKSDAKQGIGTFAVYCDDSNGKVTVFGNIFYRCQCAFLLHGGHYMTVENNLILDACEKSVFSFRVHRYAYWTSLVKGEDETTGGGHWVWINKSTPWRSQIWREKYPHLAEPFEWDPETEQSYPHKCMIRNNFIINHRKVDFNFNFFTDGWGNRFMNNPQISDRKFLGIPDGDELDLSNNRMEEILPDFERLPFEKMGMLK